MAKVRKSLSLSLVLVLVLVLSLLPAVALASDYDNHWAKEYIVEARSRGWVTADEAEFFSPDDPITRADFAMMIWRALGSPHGGAGNPFNDVLSTAMYYDAVLALYEKGVITGVSDIRFAPDDPLTREMGVTMLGRAFSLKAANPVAYANYSDSNEMSSWAMDAISAMTELGYIEGVDGNQFAPKKMLTCGETVKLLVTVSDSGESTVQTGLYAGAGVGIIDFTGLFDESVGGSYEGFSGEIADAPHARVLLLESNRVKVALISLELVNCPEQGIDICKDVVNKLTGTPIDNIWVHATHAITTPHLGGTDAQQLMYLSAIQSAIIIAAKQAIDSFQPAVAGVGSVICDVNANRNVLLNDRYYYGLGSTYGESDKTMTILRVDSMSTGDPIGFLINYGMKPDVINNTKQSVNGRAISSDAPGYLCNQMELEYRAPALYLMGDAADQVAKITSDYYKLDDNGEVERVELSVTEGLAFAAEIGNTMNADAKKIVDAIDCSEDSPVITIRSTSFTWLNKDEASSGTVAVSALRIGDNLVLVGLKPEVNALTGLALRDASPFANTVVVSFMNGDQKYMPDAQAYDDSTWEVSRTDLSPGAAEEFVRIAAELLEK